MNEVSNAMKLDKLFIILVFTILSTCLLVFSNAGSYGALVGLKLSYSTIIPSLFPFTVCALIIFECYLSQSINIKKITRLNEIIIYLISLIGGFPVGAKLIEKAYVNKQISKSNAEFMLAFCVNSGPAFIIIVIGSGFLSSIKLGYLLFTANLLATLTLLIFYIIYFPKHESKKVAPVSKSFSENFVSSTYEATQAILMICAYVVLFSTIIEIIKKIITVCTVRNYLISLLEITNGIAYAENNIYYISFLLGFSGLCVHFQVISMCSTLKPNYFKFLLFRLIHGALNIFYVKELTKILKISTKTISLRNNIQFCFTNHSILFGVLFIMLSIAFMLSVKKENNIL